MFYNRARYHSHLGGVSPEAFERPRRDDRICLHVWGQSTDL
ncbi:hypothetical protein [Enterobacter cancerogenus]